MQDNVLCRDGLRLSIAASRLAYCTPRDDAGPWQEVEVCASQPIEGWEPYFDAQGDYGYVYGYVPIGDLQRLIEAHTAKTD